MAIGYFPDLYQPPWMRQNPWATKIAAGEAAVRERSANQEMEQRAQEFPLKMEALKMAQQFDQAALPLKLKGLELANQLNTTQAALDLIKKENMVKDQELALQVEKSRGVLADLGSTLSKFDIWGTDSGEEAAWKALGRHPWLAQTPEWIALQTVQKDARTAKAKVAESQAERENQVSIWGRRTDTQMDVARLRADTQLEVAKMRTRIDSVRNMVTPGEMKEMQLALSEYQHTVDNAYGIEAQTAKYEAALAKLRVVETRANARNAGLGLGINAPPPSTGKVKPGDVIGGFEVKGVRY